MTREELEAAVAAIDATGRPETVWAPRKEFLRAQREQEAWAEAHPELDLERKTLLGQLCVMDEARANEDRARAVERAAELRVAASGAGDRAVQAARTPRETDAMTEARAWLKSTSWVLVMTGDVGKGKTVAAAWVLSECARSATVEWRKAAEVTRLSNFGDGGADFERLKRCGLLVLDDLGAEQLDDRGRGLLVELLDARYEARKRTVVTANPSWPQLQMRLGQRAADRLIDGGRVVELRGKSLRGGPEATHV